MNVIVHNLLTEPVMVGAFFGFVALGLPLGTVFGYIARASRPQRPLRAREFNQNVSSFGFARFIVAITDPRLEERERLLNRLGQEAIDALQLINQKFRGRIGPRSTATEAERRLASAKGFFNACKEYAFELQIVANACQVTPFFAAVNLPDRQALQRLVAARNADVDPAQQPSLSGTR